jgi:hypothetical protein
MRESTLPAAAKPPRGHILHKAAGLESKARNLSSFRLAVAGDLHLQRLALGDALQIKKLDRHHAQWCFILRSYRAAIQNVES